MDIKDLWVKEENLISVFRKAGLVCNPRTLSSAMNTMKSFISEEKSHSFHECCALAECHQKDTSRSAHDHSNTDDLQDSVHFSTAATTAGVLNTKESDVFRFLPHEESPPVDISRHFSRLDITGEGRLTFLTLRSALEILGCSRIEDSHIRHWIKSHDHGEKGFVDWDDFQEIFSPTSKTDSSDSNHAKNFTFNNEHNLRK